jgi:hypothetical protein
VASILIHHMQIIPASFYYHDPASDYPSKSHPSILFSIGKRFTSPRQGCLTSIQIDLEP